MERITSPIEAEQFLNEATSGGIAKVIRDGPKEKIKQILDLINRTITILEDSLDILSAQESCSLKPPNSKEEETVYGMTRAVIQYKLDERMAEKFACEDALNAPAGQAQVFERIDSHQFSRKEDPKLDHNFLELDKEPPQNFDYTYLLNYLKDKKIDAVENPLDNTITIFVNDKMPYVAMNAIKLNIRTEVPVKIYTIQDHLYITFSIFGILFYELNKLNLLPKSIPVSTTSLHTPPLTSYDYTYLLNFIKTRGNYEIDEGKETLSLKVYNLIADQSRLLKMTLNIASDIEDRDPVKGISPEKEIHFYDRGDQLELFSSKSSQLAHDLEREGLYIPMVVDRMHMLTQIFNKYSGDLTTLQPTSAPFNYDYLMRFLKEYNQFQIINPKNSSLHAIVFNTDSAHQMSAIKLNTVTENDVIFYHYGTLGLQLCFNDKTRLYYKITSNRLPITVV